MSRFTFSRLSVFSRTKKSKDDQEINFSKSDNSHKFCFEGDDNAKKNFENEVSISVHVLQYLSNLN